ncbi:MAG: hypothetical protein CL933_17125 [Deltaproteobacteria bacterium]|nr:hypothetical protein [Deltaproteobacteria bacterium]
MLLTNSRPVLMAAMLLTAAAYATTATAQFQTTGADVSPVLSCFYECKPGPQIQGQNTYRQVTTLPIANNGEVFESVEVNFIDGNSNVIATTRIDLDARDVDEMAVCNTIESITGSAPPRSGLIHIGNVSAPGLQEVSGVYSWIKNVNGKFFADRPEPYEGRVTGIAKSECTYVASPEVKEASAVPIDGAQAPSGPPILVEDTSDDSGQADLRPLPDANGYYCRRDPAGFTVEIGNVGIAASSPTSSRVTFTDGTGAPITTTFSTPALVPGGSWIEFPISIPSGCFAPNCHFEIEADSIFNEAESDEVNNLVNDFCLG